MMLELKMVGDGDTFAVVDFLVPPIPGDIVLYVDPQGNGRIRVRVVERLHIFEHEGEMAPCFIVVEPAP